MIKSAILVELQEVMGGDVSIAHSAWVSTYDKDKRDANSIDLNRVNSLVERLIKEKHGVPLESVVFRFWCRIPIYIDRQIVTHRIASTNGLSLRYRTAPSDYLHIPSDVNEILNKTGDTINFNEDYNNLCSAANEVYLSHLEDLKKGEKKGLITNKEYKRCREVLRGMLPLANMTERVITINLRSFANFVKLRLSEHAQPEIKQVAELMLAEVEKVNNCPMAIKALKEVGWRI